jgi:predicted DNA-binding transcriptional regulator AlpA
MPDLLTTHEVAEIIRTPADTVRYWRFLGKGPRSIKLGRRVLYDRADVEAWIADEKARQQTPSGAPA